MSTEPESPPVPQLTGSWGCTFPRPAAPVAYPGASPRDPWDGVERYEDFICVCSDEGKATAAALRQWAKTVLEADDSNFAVWPGVRDRLLVRRRRHRHGR